MQQVTLCLLVRGNKKEGDILLAMKKRRFGSGKWNGYGGKLDPGESILDGACREVREESGLVVKPDALDKVGEIDFYFPNKKEWDQTVHVFLVRKWVGDPIETEEMRPQWFRISEIPYSNMWKPDVYWLPYVLSGKKIKGRFVFSPDGEGVAEKEIVFLKE